MNNNVRIFIYVSASLALGCLMNIACIAEEVSASASAAPMQNRMHIGMFAAGHHAFNDANDEQFIFPYYGMVVGLPSLGDIICGVRIFASNYCTKYSNSGTGYEHYFNGLGGQMRYPFWRFLYLDINIDYISYSIKNEDSLRYAAYGLSQDAVKIARGFVASPGIGAHIMLGDWFYAYAGKYITYGQVGSVKSDGEDTVTDEVFNFEWKDDYQFGLGMSF